MISSNSNVHTDEAQDTIITLLQERKLIDWNAFDNNTKECMFARSVSAIFLTISVRSRYFPCSSRSGQTRVSVQYWRCSLPGFANSLKPVRVYSSSSSLLGGKSVSSKAVLVGAVEAKAPPKSPRPPPHPRGKGGGGGNGNNAGSGSPTGWMMHAYRGLPLPRVLWSG